MYPRFSPRVSSSTLGTTGSSARVVVDTGFVRRARSWERSDLTCQGDDISAYLAGRRRKR